MSRPHKAIVEYFPHYVNHGKTMFTIESKYGNDGYAFWYKLLELLGGTDHHFLDCNNTETWEFLLAKTRVNENIALSILDTCSKLNAIDQTLWNAKIIRSNNFIENLNSVYKRREVIVNTNEEVLFLCKHKPSKCIQKPSKCIQKPHSTGVIVNINPQSKVKESKGKESKEDFDFFWNLYDKNIDQEKCKNLWNNLTESERENCLVKMPAYIQFTPNKLFRKNPENYLRNKAWENETINPAVQDSKTGILKITPMSNDTR